MPDKRIVDDLTIEELEQVLAIKKRQARQGRLTRMQNNGRLIDATPAPKLTPSYENVGDFPPMMSPPRASSPKGAPAFEDALTPAYSKPKRQENRIWRTFVDRSLLLVEVCAVLGLIGIGVVLFNGFTILQNETAKAQTSAQEAIRASMPTLAPTPTLQLANVVLPGGHTSPNDTNGGQFNFNEIPANLRAQFQDQIFLPPDISRPPTLPETPIRLIIPDLNIDEIIVQGVDWEALKSGVGQLPTGTTPTDSNGNIVLAAHNDIYGQIFRHLDQLEPGMVFQIQTQTQYYDYVVVGTDIVEPDDVHVMDPRGYPAVTLISCYPYQVDTQRYIVYAEQKTN